MISIELADVSNAEHDNGSEVVDTSEVDSIVAPSDISHFDVDKDWVEEANQFGLDDDIHKLLEEIDTTLLGKIEVLSTQFIYIYFLKRS